MRRSIKFLVAFSILFLATADAGWQSRKETFESVDSATIRQLFNVAKMEVKAGIIFLKVNL